MRWRFPPYCDVEDVEPVLVTFCLFMAENRSSGAATAFELGYGLAPQDNTDNCAYPPDEANEHRGRPALVMVREGDRAPYDACDAVDGGTNDEPAKFVAPER